MKISDSDYQHLSRVISGVLQDHPEAHREYQGWGHSPKRFRWDVLLSSGLRIGDGAGMDGDIDLYAYMNDDHIDTALRQIMRDNGLEWAADEDDPSDAISRYAYEFALYEVPDNDPDSPRMIAQAEVLAVSSAMAERQVIAQFWHAHDHGPDVHPRVEIIAVTELEEDDE